MSAPKKSELSQPTSQVSTKRHARLATAAIGLGAISIWLASRLTWLTVSVFDDKSGDASHTLVGAAWSTEQVAIALLLLAGVVAALVLRKTGRRIVGAICAAGAVMASWAPMRLLTTTPDYERAKTILTSGGASQRSSNPVTVAEWAEISNIQTHQLGALLALFGCGLALIGGIILAMRPGEDGARKNQYETKKTREERLQSDLEASPDSPRVLWDALDADLDPTDREVSDLQRPSD